MIVNVVVCFPVFAFRLRSGEFGDGASSVKRFTLSTKQESRLTHRIVIPEGKQSQAGCVVFSVSSHLLHSLLGESVIETCFVMREK